MLPEIRHWPRPLVAGLGLLLLTLPTPLGAQLATGCTPAGGDAPALLRKAAGAAGIERLGRQGLGMTVTEMVSQDFQSDRTYPPYLYEGRWSTWWYFPGTGLEYSTGRAVNPFGERPMPTSWSTARGTWLQRDTTVRPFPPLHRFSSAARPLNPWALLHDWQHSSDVRVTARCRVRDFDRLRLSRGSGESAEQLYLDPGTGLPIAYERTEPDWTNLWGRRQVTYLYSNWVPAGGGQYPGASYRLVDGETEVQRTVAVLESDSAPPVPTLADTTEMSLAAAFPTDAPDTIRVGPTTFLLRTRMYTNVVALARDTVFVLDAQWSGEQRARQDSSWIATLFPGRHPVVLVVSDLAWPHIAGVRTWVAMGARVVAHRSARAFLTRVVQHRWRGEPDLLEQRRARTRFQFVPVEDSLALAGGALVAYAINGIGSEGALMTWIPGERFLYAGDYVQSLSGASLTYAREVYDAVKRVGAGPERLAAMHFPLTPWSAMRAALEPAAPDAGVGLELDPAALTPTRDNLTILLQGTAAGSQVTSLERTGAGTASLSTRSSPAGRNRRPRWPSVRRDRSWRCDTRDGRRRGRCASVWTTPTDGSAAASSHPTALRPSSWTGSCRPAP